jgi:recombination protein RecA
MHKDLDEAIKNCNKRYGKGSVMPMNSSAAAEPVDVISTGTAAIDEILGISGIPRGRITEIYGPEAGGKTTLALQIVGQAQAAGGVVCFIDAEHALDINYATALGVKVDDLLISQPSNGEEALEIALEMISSKQVAAVVIDSVAALVPQAELEGDMGAAQMGLQARLLSQAMRKLTAVISKTNTAVIFINQVRSKIGVVFGSPETTSGGRALKFYSSIRLDVRRMSQIKKGDVIIGANTKIKTAKNKLSSPFKEVEVPLHYGIGFQNPKVKA